MEKEKKRPKLSEIQIEADDLDNILEMSIRSLKAHRPPHFPNTPEGLADFKELSLQYLEYLKSVNHDPDCTNRLIPDVESWATFIGTTRATIFNYERYRDESWKSFIQQFKGIITSAKKQLAFRQKIPTVLAVFDLTNNSDYVNSSEFKLTPEVNTEKRALTAAELPKLNGMTKPAELPKLTGDQSVEVESEGM